MSFTILKRCDCSNFPAPWQYSSALISGNGSFHINGGTCFCHVTALFKGWGSLQLAQTEEVICVARFLPLKTMCRDQKNKVPGTKYLNILLCKWFQAKADN